MQYAIVPLLLGLITGCIGKYKRSSFVIWFIVGTILPFIGLAGAIMMRTERYDPRRECPNCNALVGIAVQVCPRCGEDLEYPTELVAPRGYTILDDDPGDEVSAPAEGAEAT